MPPVSPSPTRPSWSHCAPPLSSAPALSGITKRIFTPNVASLPLRVLVGMLRCREFAIAFDTTPAPSDLVPAPWDVFPGAFPDPNRENRPDTPRMSPREGVQASGGVPMAAFRGEVACVVLQVER